MMTTAAGTIRPAKVLVLGAGVAGLQAHRDPRAGSAQSSGATTCVPPSKNRLKVLAPKFLELEIGEKNAEGAGGYAKELSAEAKQKQQVQLGLKTKDFDVVITTALIPGKPAPRLVTKRKQWPACAPASVIVDSRRRNRWQLRAHRTR